MGHVSMTSQNVVGSDLPVLDAARYQLFHGIQRSVVGNPVHEIANYTDACKINRML